MGGNLAQEESHVAIPIISKPNSRIRKVSDKNIAKQQMTPVPIEKFEKCLSGLIKLQARIRGFLARKKNSDLVLRAKEQLNKKK